MDLYEEMGYAKKKVPDAVAPLATREEYLDKSNYPAFQIDIKPGDPDYEEASKDSVGYMQKVLAANAAEKNIPEVVPEVTAPTPTPVKAVKPVAKAGGVDLYEEMYGAGAKKPVRAAQVVPEKEGVVKGLVLPTGEAALRVGGALAGSMATGTGAIATHLPYLAYDIVSELRKGKPLKEAVEAGMLTASNRSVQTMEFPAKELLKTPEQQESFENIMIPLGAAGAGWRGIAEYAVTGDINKASDVVQGKSMGSSKWVPAAGALGDTSFMYALMGKNAIKARWYQLTVKERALVETAAKEVKANIKDSNLTNAQIRELWKDPKNREGLLRRFAMGETEEVAPASIQKPTVRASGVTEQPVISPTPKGKISPIEDLLNMVPETKEVPLGGIAGEGFTVKPSIEKVIKQPYYTAGVIPSDLPVEYKTRISKTGKPYKTEDYAEKVALQKGMKAEDFEIVPVNIDGVQGFGYRRVTPLKETLPIKGQESLGKTLIRDVLAEKKAAAPVVTETKPALTDQQAWADYERFPAPTDTLVEKPLSVSRPEAAGVTDIGPVISKSEVNAPKQEWYSLKDQDSPITQLEEQIKNDYPGTKISLAPYLGQKHFRVNTLDIPVSMRNKGVGTDVISRLKNFADTHGLTFDLFASKTQNARSWFEKSTDRRGLTEKSSGVYEYSPQQKIGDVSKIDMSPVTKSNVTNLITKPTRDFHKTLQGEISEGVRNIQDKVNSYEGWKWEIGDRVKSHKTGYMWEVVGKTWNNQTNTPMYVMKNELLGEKSRFYAEPTKLRDTNVPSVYDGFTKLGTEPKILEGVNKSTAVIDKEGIAAGADLTTIKARLLKDMLGYSPIRTVVGELLQNSLDATRDTGGKIFVNAKDNKVTVTDHGTGMTPEIMRDNFVTLGGQGTKGSEDMGGFGLAKLPIMGWPESVDVISVAKTPTGKVESHIWTTREEYMQEHKVNFEDRKVGNEVQTGTTVEITKSGISPYEIGSLVRNLIENIRTPQEIVVKLGDREPATYKGTPLSEAKTKYDVEKFTLPGGTEATVKFTDTEPYGWQEPYKVNVLVYNKGLLLPDIPKYSNFNFTLSKKPDFNVEVDFTRTPSAADVDNYPFLVNRTRLSEGALNHITDIVGRRIREVEANITKTNIASLKELFEKAPEFSGTKLIIPLKEENLRNDVANIIYDNPEPFIKLGHLYSSFSKLLVSVSDMKVHDFAITTEQSVHGFRPKSGLLPKDYIVINPFSYLEGIDKLYNVPPKKVLYEAATALTDTMLHEAVHNNVPGHYGDFVKEFHRITKQIGHKRLTKIEEEAYAIFKLHGTDIARITRDIRDIQANGTIADLFSDYSPETQRVNEVGGREGYPVHAQRVGGTEAAKTEGNLHSIRDLETIASGKGTVELYHEAPTEIVKSDLEKYPKSFDLYAGIDPTQTVATLKGLTKNVKEAYNYLSDVGQRIYSSGKTDFNSWKAEFKTALGELWDQYKNQVDVIWNKLKTGVLKPLMNERGSIGYDTAGERIIKQRNLGELKDGTKLKAPAISWKEFKLLSSLPDMKKKPLGGFMQNPIYTFEDWASSVGPKAATWVKEKFYYPIREATHRADLHFSNIFEKVEARRKNLPHSSSRRIYTYAISKETGGAEILKNMGIKEIPKLTEGEMEAYNWMRRGYESMYNQINAARIASGIEPISKVKDYFTFAADMTLAEELGFGFNDAMLGKFVHPKATRFRYAIERIGGIQKVHTDSFGIFERYMKSATKHIYLSPEIAKMREFTGKFSTGGGKFWSMKDEQPRAYRAITKYLDFLTGERMSILPDALERSMVMLNKNITTATLSSNFRSAIIQPTALHNTYIEIGPKFTAKGAIDLMMGKGDEAIKKSKVLFNREFDVDIKQTYEGVFGRIGSLKKAINDSWLGMKPLKYLDMQTATTTWLGAYEKATKFYKMSEEKAVRYADDTVIRTQGSAAAHDLAPIQRIALGRFFSTFQSFVINNFNFLAKDVLGIKNPMLKPAESLHRVGRYVFGAVIVNTIFEELLGINSPLPAPVRAAKKTYAKNQDVKEATLSAALEFLQVVPGFGGLRYGSGMTGAGIDYLKDVTNKLGEEAGEYRGKTKSWFELAGKAAGVPGTGQIAKTQKILEKGGTLPEAILGRYPETSKNVLFDMSKDKTFNFDKE